MTFLFAPLTHYLYPLAWSSCTEQPVGESGLVTSAMEQTARINERLRKLVWPRLCFTCCYTTVDHPNPNERLSPPRPVPRGRQHFGMSWLCRSARCSKGMPQATGLSPIAVFDSRNSRRQARLQRVLFYALATRTLPDKVSRFAVSLKRALGCSAFLSLTPKGPVSLAPS